MSADAAAADAAERRLNHSIPRTYFVRGIQISKYGNKYNWLQVSHCGSHNTIELVLLDNGHNRV